MSRGTYARTPITIAKQKLTRTEQRIERFRAKIAEDEAHALELEKEIESLLKADAAA